VAKVLVDGVKDEGVHQVCWNGLDANGEKAANGIYVCRMQCGNRSLTGKMFLVR
jgi:flagellar hook assembly protein FlgD